MTTFALLFIISKEFKREKCSTRCQKFLKKSALTQSDEKIIFFFLILRKSPLNIHQIHRNDTSQTPLVIESLIYHTIENLILN